MIEKNSKSILHHQAAPLKISGSEIRLLLETLNYLDFGHIYFDENNRQNKDGKNCYGKMLKSQEETRNPMLNKKKIVMARAKVCIFRRLS